MGLQTHRVTSSKEAQAFFFAISPLLTRPFDRIFPMEPTVCNKYKMTPEELASPRCIDLQRGTPLGNPYVMGLHGTRDEVIALYREWLITAIYRRDAAVLNQLASIRPNSLLLCTCAPLPCHVDVVVEFWKLLYAEGDPWENMDTFIEAHPIETPGYSPLTDGVDHINIYSKGKTELGRWMTNFAHSSFTLPEHGTFASIEGYWYWLMTGKQHETLRHVYGFAAKETGKELSAGAPGSLKTFMQDIKAAILAKYEQCPEMRAQLQASTLPLTHYYSYGKDENAKIVFPVQYRWQTTYWETLRAHSQGKAVRLLIAGSRYYADPIGDVFDDVGFAHDAYRKSGYQAIEIVSGHAKGADQVGERLAGKLGLPVKLFKANWNKHKKAAGAIRNVEMAEYLDQDPTRAAGLFLWNGRSTGTAHMQDQLKSRGIPSQTFVFSK